MTSGKTCGGALIGSDAKGCGTLLIYESSSNGIEYWRCPRCGNPHWWPITKATVSPQE